MNYAQPGMQPTRTSAAAIASLICGILGCFIITGIAAIITGIIGLRATRNPQVKGRGLAIAGLSLGVLTTLAGTGCLVSTGGFAYWAYRQYAPAVEAMNGLATAASAGNADQVMNYVDPSRISRADVDALIAELQPLGTPTGFVPANPQVNNNNGITTVNFDGTIQYPNNVTRTASVQLVKQPDGSYKATKLDVR
jgi:hypothetical protein